MPCFKMAKASYMAHLKTSATIPFQKQGHDKMLPLLETWKLRKNEHSISFSYTGDKLPLFRYHNLKKKKVLKNTKYF